MNLLNILIAATLILSTKCLALKLKTSINNLITFPNNSLTLHKLFDCVNFNRRTLKTIHRILQYEYFDFGPYYRSIRWTREKQLYLMKHFAKERYHKTLIQPTILLYCPLLAIYFFGTATASQYTGNMLSLPPKDSNYYHVLYSPFQRQYEILQYALTMDLGHMESLKLLEVFIQGNKGDLTLFNFLLSNGRVTVDVLKVYCRNFANISALMEAYFATTGRRELLLRSATLFVVNESLKEEGIFNNMIIDHPAFNENTKRFSNLSGEGWHDLVRRNARVNVEMQWWILYSVQLQIFLKRSPNLQLFQLTESFLKSSKCYHLAPHHTRLLLKVYELASRGFKEVVTPVHRISLGLSDRFKPINLCSFTMRLKHWHRHGPLKILPNSLYWRPFMIEASPFIPINIPQNNINSLLSQFKLLINSWNMQLMENGRIQMTSSYKNDFYLFFSGWAYLLKENLQIDMGTIFTLRRGISWSEAIAYFTERLSFEFNDGDGGKDIRLFITGILQSLKIMPLFSPAELGRRINK